jgi:hypothetical protein
MHAIPEKLNALRQQMEATLIRRLHDQREEIDLKLAESCKATEDAAVQRCSGHIMPKVEEGEKKLQAKLDQVQLKADKAPPRIQEVWEQCIALKNEITPLHTRADAAAARLDRLGVQSATTSKDCSVLSEDFQNVVNDLRAMHDESDRKRDNLEMALRGTIQANTDGLVAAQQAAIDRADEQNRQMTAFGEGLENRLRRALAECEERGRRESNLADEGVINKLMPEIQTLEAMLRQKTEECNANADRLTNANGLKLREEMDTMSKRVTLLCDQTVDRKAREIALLMDQGLAQANRSLETVRETGDAALRDQVLAMRTSMGDYSTEAAKNLETLRNMVVAVETRSMSAADQARVSAIDASTCKLEESNKVMRNNLELFERNYSRGDETLRDEMQNQLQAESAKQRAVIEDVASKCTNSSTAAIGLASATLREDLTKAMREANERNDAARCAAADALSREAQLRQKSFDSSDNARETLAKNLRDELRSTGADIMAKQLSAVAGLNQRHDHAAESIRNLDHGLQTAVKDHMDAMSSLNNQLKAERQATEEGEVESARRQAQIRDSLENRLQSESSDIRKCLGDCQKKIHDEGADIRKQMREKAGKNEVADVARQCQERCQEVATAMDNHRGRLEGSVNDFAARYREVHQDANESRLRGQREAIALGGEVTQLRAACTSLANGTLKALQIVGLVGGEDPGAALGENGSRGVEVEDLLKWEKAGRSLAHRVERQWYKQEAQGIPTLLALVDRKNEFDAEELSSLKMIIENWSRLSPEPGLGGTWSAMGSMSRTSPMPNVTPGASTATPGAGMMYAPMPPQTPDVKKPGTAPAGDTPQAVKELRQRQMGQ